MKTALRSFLLFTLLFSSHFVFAGPEESFWAQKCFALDPASALSADVLIPREICIETIAVNALAESIRVTSVTHFELYRNTQLDYVVPQSADSFLFRSSSLFYELANPACGSNETLEVLISGRVDQRGETDMNQLHISVRAKSNLPSCQRQVDFFEYTPYR